jgi:hypothetical protein
MASWPFNNIFILYSIYCIYFCITIKTNFLTNFDFFPKQIWLIYLLFVSMLLKPDRPVQPVGPETGPSTGPDSISKPVVRRTGLKTGVNRMNLWTGPGFTKRAGPVFIKKNTEIHFSVQFKKKTKNQFFYESRFSIYKTRWLIASINMAMNQKKTSIEIEIGLESKDLNRRRTWWEIKKWRRSWKDKELEDGMKMDVLKYVQVVVSCYHYTNMFKKN